MRKIPTLYIRDAKNMSRLTDVIDPDCQWVLDGEGMATQKFDGTACWINGEGALFKRHTMKPFTVIPPEWEASGDESPDGTFPGWMPCIFGAPEDRRHNEGFDCLLLEDMEPPDGTYELVGPKVQGNPYGLDSHELWRHGSARVGVEGTTPADLEWTLRHLPIEGVVWHHPDGRMAKIKARDFGIPWPR